MKWIPTESWKDIVVARVALQGEVATTEDHLVILHRTVVTLHQTVGTHQATKRLLVPILLQFQLTKRQFLLTLRQFQLTQPLHQPIKRQLLLTQRQILATRPLTQELAVTKSRTQITTKSQAPQQPLRKPLFKNRRPTNQTLTALTRTQRRSRTLITTRQLPRRTHLCTFTTGLQTTIIQTVTTQTPSWSSTMTAMAITSIMGTLAITSTHSMMPLQVSTQPLSITEEEVEVVAEQPVSSFQSSVSAVSAVACGIVRIRTRLITAKEESLRIQICRISSSLLNRLLWSHQT